ncbi:hypothetical protein A3K73_06225 [Candidatus Pacearchaeota archaeon RBG_13_36_9]|nr:MAG: hypothetical protein A3K73_06225 [Candidatus Pacearchaeota archaeon RBG_13_36_9]
MENDSRNETGKKGKVITEEIGAIKRIYSRLYFVRGDIEAIEKMEIKSEAIKGLISGISNRTEILMEMLLGELNEKSRITQKGSPTGAG